MQPFIHIVYASLYPSSVVVENSRVLDAVMNKIPGAFPDVGNNITSSSRIIAHQTA